MCVNSQEPPDDRFRRHREKLSEIIGENSTIYAIPLQMGYTTEDKIIEAVKDLQVHQMHRPNVQFACATRAIVYSNHVCSMWIYVAGVVHE